jgi:hypothetical protein
LVRGNFVAGRCTTQSRASDHQQNDLAEERIIDDRGIDKTESAMIRRETIIADRIPSDERARAFGGRAEVVAVCR